MRIVAELPRPDCKITIFSMNMKYLVKFEKGTYEQTYKLAEMNLLDGINSVFELLDEEFIQTVLARFDSMRTDFNATYNRH
ncbi:hypothetical protein GS399_13860 [Pedobacter sp. HMF7647]|uniref:Uncharacterized protein n=1 Tax=Hufsiella arboris TaxID=2695275 RepID=A0A7K1YCF6_9SPHI|nr:hypothetical protein [Hufsiella arboris]MXV52061.1 hypothetical protein [Hufsiella arboris]